MSGNETTATLKADNPNDQKFELVTQYPGQVKFSGPPRRRSARPRRSDVEQLTLPGLQTSNDQEKAV